MNLTFGFIAFFISVIIPGILFRRFFYYGEFSKQFDSKDPVLHSIFYSIVPGVCIQVICFVLGDWIFKFGVENTTIFNIFKDFVYSGEKDINSDTKTFLENSLDTFIYYSLIVFLFSILSGYILSRVIRWWNLDKKYKILKFKNQWYYIFSGEILNFKKFELGKTLTTDTKVPHNHKISITYADILVDNTEGMRELYTGYVVDYDLCSEDISQLKRVYLLDAYRYKKIDNDYKSTSSSLTIPFEKIMDSETKKETQVSDDKIKEKVEFKSRVRKKIPGDILVVNAKDILNINLTYVPSEKKREIQEERKQRVYTNISSLYTFIVVGLIGVHISYASLDHSTTWFGNHLKESNWFSIVFVFIGFLQILAPFFPILNDTDKKYSYSVKNILTKILTFFIFYLIACLLQKWGFLSYDFPIWNPALQ